MARTPQPKPETTGQAQTGGSAVAVLNLRGEKITDCRADAEPLGRLITHLAEANRALSQAIAENRYEDSRDSKGRATKRRVKTRPLQIQPLNSAQTGLSISLCAPETSDKTQLIGAIEEHLPIEGLAEDTIESEALRTILRTFTTASQTDSLEPEDLITQLETATVRDAVRKAVATLQHQGWEISGKINQANREPETVKLTKRGQARLGDALKTDLIGKYRWQVKGSIDGHKNSNNTIYFRALNSGQSWSTTAATDAIFAEAARTSLDPGNEVELTVEFEPKTDREGNPTERVSKTIVSIDRVYRSDSTEKLF